MLLGVAGLVAGQLPSFNPPQCGEPHAGSSCIIGANIGAGMLFFLSIGLLIIGLMIVVSSLLRSFMVAHDAPRWASAVVPVCIVFGLLVLGIYVLAVYPHAQREASRAEYANQWKNFVAYDTPTIRSTTIQTDSAKLGTSRTGSSDVLLDLTSCKPGVARLETAQGKVYVLFSGIRQNKYIAQGNDSDCVFYVGKEPRLTGGAAARPAWDGALTMACVWPLDPNHEYNQRTLEVTAAGITFKEFPGICAGSTSGTS